MMMMMEPNNSRTIVISSEIDSEVARQVIERIEEINDSDNQRATKEIDFKRVPIKMILNTPGGSVLDGFAIIAAMTTSETPVVTICYGMAMSMGFAIFAAGEERYIHELSTLMYHEVSGSLWGKLSEIKLETSFMERLQDQYDKFVLSHTNITKEKLDEVKKGRTEWYLSADDALKLGVADGAIMMETVKQ